MKKLVLFVFTLSVFAACQNTTKPVENTSAAATKVIKQLTTEDFAKLDLLDKTDNCDALQSTDSTVFKYANVTVTRIPNKDMPSEIVRVLKDGKTTTFSEEVVYFKGIIGDCLILDLGTSTIRDVMVYDLKTMKMTVKNEYVEELKIENQMIVLKAEVKIADITKKPKCPKEDKATGLRQGFVEEKHIDLATFQVINTRKYECALFQ